MFVLISIIRYTYFYQQVGSLFHAFVLFNIHCRFMKDKGFGIDFENDGDYSSWILKRKEKKLAN